MNDPRKQLENRYNLRRKSILKSVKDDIVFISSGIQKFHSRDLEVPFRQDSDFYYLTGFNEPNSVLVLRGNNKPRSILYLKDRDPLMEQ